MSFVPPATQPITWAGYLEFLSNIVGVPEASLPPPYGIIAPGTPNPILDSHGVPITDSAGNLILASGSSGGGYGVLVIDSSGNQIFDSSGNAVTSSPSTVPPQVWSLVMALDIVTEALRAASGFIYNWAVYNLAADRLINFARDAPGQSYFQGLRKDFGIGTVSVGVVSAAGDQSTNTSILNPKQFEYLTFFDLQVMKTPYGREYLGIAQMYGQGLWGLS